MTDLDWRNASQKSDELLVSPADRAWAETFDEVAGIWSTESRGQPWQGAQLGPDGKAVVVFGIASDATTEDLKRHLRELLDAVDRQSETARRRASREQASGESDQQAETAKRLADELRGGDQEP